MKGVDPATHEVSAELVCAPSLVCTAADLEGEDKNVLRKSQEGRGTRITYAISPPLSRAELNLRS